MKKTIGSHPGAISFRFSLMVILILIFISFFFIHIRDAERDIERVSIEQTKRVIDSSLVVVFSSLAIKGELNQLNRLVGANPFELMRDFSLTPTGYKGIVETASLIGEESGWYYVKGSQQITYKPRYDENRRTFKLMLDFDDLNQSGIYEVGEDNFRHLYLKQLPQQ